MLTGSDYRVCWQKYKKDILAVLILLFFFGNLCCYQLFSAGEYSGDEFFTLEDTLGFLHTGKWVEWDFITETTKGPSADSPYFLLLSLWIRAFGTNPLATRSLSVFLGLFGVLSYYYVARKLTGNMAWALLSGILFVTNATVVGVAISVRGYALLLLLNIWIFYFIYLALNYEWRRDVHGRAGTFLKEYLGFGYHYVAAALLLIFIAFKIRVFEPLYLIGICVYTVYRAFRTREKKFIITGSLFSAAVILFVLAAVLQLERYLPFFAGIIVRLQQFGSLGAGSPEYWGDLFYLFRIVPVTVAGYLLTGWCLYSKKVNVDRHEKDVVVFMASIAFATVLFFATAVNRAHIEKYIVAIYPAAMLTVVAGFYFYFREKRGSRGLFWCGVLFCCFAVNVLGIWTEREEGECYTEAYEKVAEYTRGKPVFITGIRLRGYYANDILGAYTWQSMTDKGTAPDISHLEELSAIGREHPQGILTCEEVRWYHLRNSFWQLLNMDSFEKISGTGLDETRVANWAYHLSYPEEGAIREEERSITVFGFNFGGASHITEKEDRTVVELELNGSVPEQMLLCMKVNQYYAGERKQRYVQLVLEPNGESVQYYRIELENDMAPLKSTIDDSYCIYSNGNEPESYEDCFTL